METTNKRKVKAASAYGVVARLAGGKPEKFAQLPAAVRDQTRVVENAIDDVYDAEVAIETAKFALKQAKAALDTAEKKLARTLNKHPDLLDKEMAQ